MSSKKETTEPPNGNPDSEGVCGARPFPKDSSRASKNVTSSTESPSESRGNSRGSYKTSSSDVDETRPRLNLQELYLEVEELHLEIREQHAEYLEYEAKLERAVKKSGDTKSMELFQRIKQQRRFK